MCIQTRIQKAILEKAALDAKIAKLEKLEAATAPVKNLLSELLADYAAEAPEDLAEVWGEVLAIGQKFDLSVQPLAADELKQWEAALAENARLKQQLEEAHIEITEQDRSWGELSDERDDLEKELAELRSQMPTPTIRAEYELATGNDASELSEAQCQQQQLEVWEKETQAPVITEEEAHELKTIPALTLWQPWATLIAEEVKRIETRSWATHYRGPIAIHAAKKPVSISDYPDLFELLPDNCEFPLGAVVAIVNLVDCVEMTPEFIAQQSEQELKCGDWQPGRFAWILEIIRPVVPPIPASGGQKLWNWSGTSITAELEYLEESKAVLFVGNEYDACFEDDEPTTIDSILMSAGFQHPEQFFTFWDTKEKYENYRGWDVYFSVPNGGIVAIGLHDTAQSEAQAWDASSEVIQELDPTFPESLADYDKIVAWTRILVDQVKNLEFPNPTEEQIEEELGCSWEEREPTKLQEFIAGRRSDIPYIFDSVETGAGEGTRIFVTLDRVIAPADDTVDFESEEARIKVAIGETRASISEEREYFVNGETFLHQHKDGFLRHHALGYAKFLVQELGKEKLVSQKIKQFSSPLEFEVAAHKIVVYPQLPMGVTFRFLDLEGRFIFAKSLLAVEIADRSYEILAADLIQEREENEIARKEKEANPYKKPEDDFIEFVRLTPAVGYIKRRDNGELISAYAAFSNRDAAGGKTETLAKPRAKKWKEFWHSSFESCGWRVDEPRKVKRMQSEPGAKQVFAYEIKITGKFSIGQLQKLAEEDFSLLPNEIADKPVEPVTAPAPNFRVIVNGFEMASGKNEEVLARFEEELAEFGDAGKTSVSLMRGSEVVERYAVADFNFIEAPQDFDSDNPEYFVLHRPTQINLRVYRSITSGAKWVNSIYPHSPLDTKEAAAVDGVRRKLKAEKAE